MHYINVSRTSSYGFAQNPILQNFPGPRECMGQSDPNPRTQTHTLFPSMLTVNHGVHQV
jgi:hypothetical protein